MHSHPEPSLAQLQRNLRDVIVAGEAATLDVTGTLISPERLAIHLRNFERSLVDGLLTKFPATQWLVGTTYLTQTATQYVHENPPSVPCIAEYGWGFPDFLFGCPGADRVPYLRDFARLELHVGHVSIAVSETPAFSVGFGTEISSDTTVILQSGLRYLDSGWPVDQLLHLYLSDSAPDQLTFNTGSVWLEIQGSRGDFQIRRLSHADFRFREALRESQTIEAAAATSMQIDPEFDVGEALGRMIASGVVSSINLATQ